MVRKRWPFVAGAGIAVSLAMWASYPSHCPIELKFLSVESTDFVDDSGKVLCLVTLSVHNPGSSTLRFQPVPMTCEAKIANRWVEAPSRWSRSGLGPKQSANELFLIAPDADACRFRLKYGYVPAPLPLGIGNPWARVNPPSRLSAHIQTITKRLSSSLYDSLWPPDPIG